MLIKKALSDLGKYCLFMGRVVSVPDRWKVFLRRTANEIYLLGIDSIPLTAIISIFIGAVITIQMKLNISSPLIPAYTIGCATREIVVLEFSSSILCLILAGKVGSSIASEIGTMRVTEQIDALNIMGVNSANYLVLPKVLGFLIYIPVLCVFSMFMSLIGGWIIAEFTDVITVTKYVYGLQAFFNPFYVWYAIIKSMIFSVIITSVASFMGYYVQGGSVEVGKASTRAVVNSSILILLFDVILTKVLLQ